MAGLSVGVVGLGLGRHHVEGYSDSPDVERIVICDPNTERVAAIRGAFPIVAAAYASIPEMLAAESLDAVSITTPDHLHCPHAVECLEAGCDVLLAKPIATNLEDARAIVRASEGGGKTLMLAHERRYRASTIAIKAMLEAGELGEVIHLTIDSIQDKREQFRRAPWYASPEAGRSAIVGSGIHQVDLVRYLMAKPVESVVAMANRMGGMAFPKEKTTAALFGFPGGSIGQVTVSYEAHWPPSQRVDGHVFRLIGTKGVIMGERVAFDGRDEWVEIPETPNPLVHGTWGCVAAFLDILARGRRTPSRGGTPTSRWRPPWLRTSPPARGGPSSPIGRISESRPYQRPRSESNARKSLGEAMTRLTQIRSAWFCFARTSPRLRPPSSR